MDGHVVPHIHWTDTELQVKARMHKQILYSYSDMVPGGSYHAWPGIQPHLQQECSLARQNCTLTYVPWEGVWNEDVLTPIAVNLASAARAHAQILPPRSPAPRWPTRT